MKYRIFCETEQKYIEIENLLLREVCPIDPNHVVQSGSMTVIDSDYTDCSSKDYRRLRHELIEYVTQNFSTMSIDELRQAALHFCAPVEVINQFFSTTEQLQNGKEFHKQATKCRKDRFDGAVTALFNYLTYEETGQIITSLDDYIWKYVDLGVEGTTEGDIVGVFDYFTSTSGTTFENSGFLNTGFVPQHSISLIQLRDFILNILQNGCAVAAQSIPTAS
jgi:hypothetical protein